MWWLTCNPSTQEAEAGGLLQVPDQSGLESEFKASLSCMGRPCLKGTERKKSNPQFRKLCMKPQLSSMYLLLHLKLSLTPGKKEKET